MLATVRVAKYFGTIFTSQRPNWRTLFRTFETSIFGCQAPIWLLYEKKLSSSLWRPFLCFPFFVMYKGKLACLIFIIANSRKSPWLSFVLN